MRKWQAPGGAPSGLPAGARGSTNWAQQPSHRSGGWRPEGRWVQGEPPPPGRLLPPLHPQLLRELPALAWNTCGLPSATFAAWSPPQVSSFLLTSPTVPIALLPRHIFSACPTPAPGYTPHFSSSPTEGPDIPGASPVTYNEAPLEVMHPALVSPAGHTMLSSVPILSPSAPLFER